jgi:hypothetical protein
VSFADDLSLCAEFEVTYFIRCVEILSVRKRDHHAWSKSRSFMFASISRRGIQVRFLMQISMDGSDCDSRLFVVRKEEGVTKHWRYETTELLSHASMPVFGGLVNTLTRIDIHHKPPFRTVFSSEPQPKDD